MVAVQSGASEGFGRIHYLFKMKQPEDYSAGNRPTRRKFLGLTAAGTVTALGAGVGVVAALRTIFSKKQPEAIQEKVTPASLAKEILSEESIRKAKEGQGISGQQEMPPEEIPGFVRSLEALVNKGLENNKTSPALVFIAWAEPPHGPMAVQWRLRRKDARPRLDRGSARM